MSQEVDGFVPRNKLDCDKHFCAVLGCCSEEAGGWQAPALTQSCNWLLSGPLTLALFN
jgi:hypothetical protein